MSLDLVEKGKTFDMIMNDLITFYQKFNKKYIKDYKKWEKDYKKYDKEKEVWDKLFKWAKSKGFKP